MLAPSDMHETRLDWALVLGAALTAGGLAVVAPREVVMAGLLTLALARAKGRRPTRGGGRSVLRLAVLAAVIGTAGLLRAELRVSRHEAARAAAASAMPSPERCAARARVVSSPVLVRGSLRWDAALDRVSCNGSPLAWIGRATLYGGPEDLARGDVADVVATLGAPQRLWNASGGDPRPAAAHRDVVRSGGTLDVRTVRRGRGLSAWIDRTRGGIRRRIQATFPAAMAPMARALVLGESDLAPGDDQSFRASGLSHLLAVSGMHLVLVLALVVRLLEGTLARIGQVAGRVDGGRVAALVALPVAWVYAELAGAGGSTMRAAWMATAALMARALGRRADADRAFGLSMLAMAVSDPLVAFDLSFVLSAGATAGLLAFAAPLGSAIKARLPTRLAMLAAPLSTTLAASIPCVPILARFAPTVPLGGVAANLLAVPLGESVALPLCLAHALLAWCPAAARGCALAASGALVGVRWVAHAFSGPALAVEVPQPTSWQLVVSTVALVSLVLHTQRRLVLSVSCGAMLVLELLARRAGSPRGLLRVTFLDVGQGDAAIVDLPDGQAMVVDGGGLVGSPIDIGVRVLAPELRARRRAALTAVVLTHPHPDHFGGLATGLGQVRVGALWDTGEGEGEGVLGGYAALLGAMRAQGVPVLHPAELCGARDVGGVRVEVLAPCPGYSSDWGPNDNSFVLRLSFGSRAILLVGDAERQEEAMLLGEARGKLRADVLKVGHHGSRTSSSPAFVAAVSPREAIVSVGCRNRFGHPHPLAIQALSSAGARIWRTDEDGAVTVTTDGSSLEVSALAGRALPR